MGDFAVERGSVVIASSASTATITEGVDYSVKSSANAWIRICNTRQTGNGRTSGGGPVGPDDFSTWVQNPENLATSITFERGGSPATDCRVFWELVEYVGNPGDANEVKVRLLGQTSFASGSTQEDELPADPESPFVDEDQGLVLITGQGADSTGNGYWQRFQFHGYVLASGNVRLERGNSGATAEVSWVALEFTGSNWKNPQRTTFRSSDHAATVWTTGSPNNSGTQSIPTALSDASKAFLVVQYRNGAIVQQGLDDCGENVELSASTTALTTRRRTATGDTGKFLTVWIVENTQSGAGAMSVEHVSHYESDTSAAEENGYAVAVSSVAALATTSIMGECSSCDGSGTPYPRGSAGLELTSTTQVTATVCDTGQEERWSFDVVEWPTAPIEITPGAAETEAEAAGPTEVEVAVPIAATASELELEAVDPTEVEVGISISEPVSELELEAVDPAVETGVAIAGTAVELELEAGDPAEIEVGIPISELVSELELEAVDPAEVEVAVPIAATAAELELEAADPAAVEVAVPIAATVAELELEAGDPVEVAVAVPIVATVVELELEAVDPVVWTNLRDEIVLAFERRVRLTLSPTLAASLALSLPPAVARVFAVAAPAALVLAVPGTVDVVGERILDSPALTGSPESATIEAELGSRRVLESAQVVDQVLEPAGQSAREIEFAATAVPVLEVPGRVDQVLEVRLPSSYELL